MLLMQRFGTHLRRVAALACYVAVLPVLSFSAPASAQLSIEITGGGANRIPVAIADFGGDAGASRTLTSVVRADLERSGLFQMIDAAGVAMTETTPPNFADWKGLEGETLAELLD